MAFLLPCDDDDIQHTDRVWDLVRHHHRRLGSRRHTHPLNLLLQHLETELLIYFLTMKSQSKVKAHTHTNWSHKWKEFWWRWERWEMMKCSLCPFKGKIQIWVGGREEVSQVPSRALNWLSSRVESLTFIYLLGSPSLLLASMRVRRALLNERFKSRFLSACCCLPACLPLAQVTLFFSNAQHERKKQLAAPPGDLISKPFPFTTQARTAQISLLESLEYFLKLS